MTENNIILFNGRYILINIDFLNNLIFTISCSVAQIDWNFPCDLQNQVYTVTPGNLIARSRQKSARSRQKHPFSVKSARAQYNPPVIHTLFSQSRLM